MASIPLPALDVRTQAPSQANPLQQYGELMGLRNQMQNAPLQRAAMQNEVTAGQQENQQRQLQLQDQQNLRSAAQGVDWSASDAFDKFLTGAQKSGVSPVTLSQLSMQRQQYLKSVADTDTATNTANLATNNMLLGHMETLEGITDPTKRAQTSQSIGQQILSEGSAKNPQILQTAQAMASGQMVPNNDQLDSFKAGLLDHKTVLSEALQTAQTSEANAKTAESQANTAKTNAETNYYQQNGGAPGVPAEMMQQADWLKKNPSKGPSDFLLWKLQHTPTAMMMSSNLLGNDPQALDFAAQNYRQTGQLPSELGRSPETVKSIIGRAAQLDQQAGGQGIAYNKSAIDANRKSLDNVQKQFDTVNAFETTAGKNIDMALQKAAAIPDLGARFANVPIRSISANMIGTPEMAEFKTALATAQTESAKVLNSAQASGVLSDTARKELEDITSGNLSLKAMQGQWGVIKQDMQNRHDSYQQQIGDIQNRIKGPATAPPTQNQPNATPNGFNWNQFGAVTH